MTNIKHLQAAYAHRTEQVLKKEGDLPQAMKDVEQAAYSGGLVTEATHLDSKGPEEFGRQLWVENPAALDWLNLKEGNLRNPLTISDMADLLDVLGS